MLWKQQFQRLLARLINTTGQFLALRGNVRS
jgi:hypothetical protein